MAGNVIGSGISGGRASKKIEKQRFFENVLYIIVMGFSSFPAVGIFKNMEIGARMSLQIKKIVILLQPGFVIQSGSLALVIYQNQIVSSVNLLQTVSPPSNPVIVGISQRRKRHFHLAGSVLMVFCQIIVN